MKRIITAAIALCIAASAYSQSLSALLIPTDCRSLAMGGATLRPDAPELEADAYFGKWAPGTVDNTVVGADVWFRIGSRLALSLGGKDFMDKPYGISGEEGAVKNTFKPYDLIFSLGADYFVNDAISAGLKLRTITSALAEKATGSAFCADIYAAYSGGNWTAAISGRNLGTKINYGGGDWPLPALIAADGSWAPIKGLKVAAEADYLLSGALMAAAGAEYCIADIAFVRAGFHYGDEAKALPTFVSVGAGAQFKGISLDAAFLLASKTIGNSLMVSLGYSF